MINDFSWLAKIMASPFKHEMKLRKCERKTSTNYVLKRPGSQCDNTLQLRTSCLIGYHWMKV